MLKLDKNNDKMEEIMSEENKPNPEEESENRSAHLDRMRRLTQQSENGESDSFDFEHRPTKGNGQTGEWLLFEHNQNRNSSAPNDPKPINNESPSEDNWFVAQNEPGNLGPQPAENSRRNLPPSLAADSTRPEVPPHGDAAQRPYLNPPEDELDTDATRVTPVAYQTSQPVKISRDQSKSDKGTGTGSGRSVLNPKGQKVEPSKNNSIQKKTGLTGKKIKTGCLMKFLIGLLFILTLILLSIVTFLVYKYFSIAAGLPDISDLQGKASQFETTRILDRNGDLLYEINDPNAGRRRYVKLENISPYIVAATIATEDKEYYNHPGFDPIAILRALWQNYTGGEVISGASTITQQLAKKLLFTPEERYEISIERKSREIVLAAEISRRYGKNEILELYLNENNYGNYSYGVQAAAESYFNTSAAQLNLAQSAFLAGIPQAPAVHDIFTNREETIKRFTQVLVLMYNYNQEKGCIEVSNQEQPICVDAVAATEALHEIENYPFKSHEAIIKYPHWVQYIRTQLEEQYGADTIYRSGFTVITTLDPEIQTFAEITVKDQLANLVDNHATDGAVVVIKPSTGEILAMVGSADFYNEEISGQVNMAVSPRQPGSSMKPLTYTAAFEKGWTPATIIWDVASEFPPSGNPNDPRDPYIPVNYDGRFHGPVTVRTALSNSYNIPAVKTLDFIGIYDDPDNPGTGGFIRFAERMGIDTLTREDYGLALTLGGGDVSLLQLTGAFGIFANGGNRIPPTAILRIEDYQGNLVYDYVPPAGEQVIRKEHAFLISSILSDTNARVPMFGPNPVINLPFQAAVKTGTTNDFRDNWTMGYTPEIAVGVWIGNADYTPMQNTTGLTGAAPIWAAIMKEIIANRFDGTTRGFTRPDGIEMKTVCAVSGAEPAEWCPAEQQEYFAYDQPPLPASEDIFQRVAMDSWTNLLASPYCSDYVVARNVLHIEDPWARKWIETTEAGKAWLEKINYTGDLYYKAERACEEKDPRPEILFAGINEGQTFTASPVDIYALIRAGDLFKNYRLEYGLGSDPKEWKTLVGSTDKQYQQPELIHSWDVMGLPAGTVSLRLTVNSKIDTNAQKVIHINLQVPTATPTITPTPTHTATASNTMPPTQTATATQTVPPTLTQTVTTPPPP